MFSLCSISHIANVPNRCHFSRHSNFGFRNLFLLFEIFQVILEMESSRNIQPNKVFQNRISRHEISRIVIRQIKFCKMLKGTVAWDFWPLFFHELIVPGPWIHRLKYFWKYFCFRGDIHKIWFFRRDFRVTIPGHLKKKNFCENSLKSGQKSTNVLRNIRHMSRYCYPENNWFPGHNTRKSIDFQVSLPGN